MVTLKEQIAKLSIWLTWGKITNFILIFLLIKLIINLIFHEHAIILDVIGVFFYTIGLICGIALTLSIDRKIIYYLLIRERRKRKSNG